MTSLICNTFNKILNLYGKCRVTVRNLGQFLNNGNTILKQHTHFPKSIRLYGSSKRGKKTFIIHRSTSHGGGSCVGARYELASDKVTSGVFFVFF
jgi:hypothetical protein